MLAAIHTFAIAYLLSSGYNKSNVEMSWLGRKPDRVGTRWKVPDKIASYFLWIQNEKCRNEKSCRIMRSRPCNMITHCSVTPRYTIAFCRIHLFIERNSLFTEHKANTTSSHCVWWPISELLDAKTTPLIAQSWILRAYLIPNQTIPCCYATDWPLYRHRVFFTK